MKGNLHTLLYNQIELKFIEYMYSKIPLQLIWDDPRTCDISFTEGM